MWYPTFIQPKGGSALKKASVPFAVTALFLASECVVYAVFLIRDLTDRPGNLWLKYAGILLCLLYALLWALRGGDKLVFPALLFTAAADWFLLIRKTHLIWGLILFLAVQSLYLIRLRRAGAAPHFRLRSMLALLLGGAVFVFRLASPLNLLTALYFSQLLSNAILAWQAKKWLFGAGLTLFACCDICVGMYNLNLFHSFASVGMWLFYLPSQVLIVLSAREVFHETK